MSLKTDSEKQKLIQDKCQIILGNLLREEDNKYCVDCDAKGPRWASWNLGIFLCIRCAGIHRNLGVHISKVKSVNLDTWTPEQVACLQQMGNSQARAVYEANLPESFRRPQIDSALEAFIRAKYEQKKYIAKEWVPPPAPKPAFDIEEEKRKEKEKKKKNKNTSAIELRALPQLPSALPRPHSAGALSPSTKPTQQETPKPASQQVPEATDLLNLGDSNSATSDDIFDGFLSAPVSTTTEAQVSSQVYSQDTSKNNISNDEADFFNQKSDGNLRQSSKMTKESILSLYGSNASQIPVTQHVAPVYGIPGNMYVTPQAYSQVAMGSYPVPSQGYNATGPTITTAVYSPFISLGPTSIRQDARQTNSWIGLTSDGGGNDSLLMPDGSGQVTQQMSNLQISGPTWNLSNNPGTVNPASLLIAPTQPTAGVMWPTPSSCQNQNISNNLWQ